MQCTRLSRTRATSDTVAYIGAGSDQSEKTPLGGRPLSDRLLLPDWSAAVRSRTLLPASVSRYALCLSRPRAGGPHSADDPVPGPWGREHQSRH